MKNILCSILLLMGCCSTLTAAEAYALLTGSGNNKTLTFYYGTRPADALDVEMSEDMSNWSWVADSMNIQTVVFDPSFAEYRPTNTCAWFNEMKNLTTIEGIENLNTSMVKDMSFMFSYCYKLPSLDVSHFDTQNVEKMNAMFQCCELLQSLDLSNFNTSQVKDMEFMFNGCSALTALDVSHFDTQNVEKMCAMFQDCKALKNLDISQFNTSKVTDMGWMFWMCSSLTELDVSHFDTQNVEQMNGMFGECQGLTFLDLSNFNTSKVTGMNWMFEYCVKLRTLNLVGFDTRNVTDMNGMFSLCKLLKSIDLSSFNTSKVDNMRMMFNQNTNLTTIYVGDEWDTENVTESDYMFNNCTKLLGENGTTYDATKITLKYAQVDGGKETPGYLTAKRGAYAQLTDGEDNGKTLTFYYGDRPYDAYCVGANYSAASNRTWKDDLRKITVVAFDSSLEAFQPLNTANWFNGCSKLKEIKGMEHLNTSEVTSMASMFYGCATLPTLNLSAFNTSKVTSMRYMFHNCSALATIYAGEGWDMSQVTSHSGMFDNCTSLVGGKGTAFDAGHVDGAYARIDGGTDAPGYFTELPDGIAAPRVETMAADTYYTLDGKRIGGCPVRKGLYIRNGKKIVFPDK